MHALKQIKCDCGLAVSAGSVFCPQCRGKVLKKNARMIKNEESRYQSKMRGKGKKR